MVDRSVEGFNKGGSLTFTFRPEDKDGSEATVVGITIRLPVPRLLGFLSGVLESQVRRELLAAVAEDKHDLEVRGYPARLRMKRHKIPTADYETFSDAAKAHA